MTETNKTFFIQTFGCQMNERDSETLAGFLEERGYLPTDAPGKADLVLINTCSVRDNADKRFFGTLGQMKRHKEQDPDFIIGVCGCMMQQPYIVTKIKEKYPWVDLVFGTNNIHRFPALLDDVLAENKREREQREAAERGEAERPKHRMEVEVYEEGGEIVEGLPASRLYEHKAFVNIMFGCNNFCTYCIVPYTRGRERSRRAEDIVAEIRELAEKGVKEVTLLGQNVNSYRSEGNDFTDLLYKVAEVDGIERIRFMTSHPKDLSDKLIAAFADLPKLCHHIHLPLQAGSDVVLKRMNRHYDSAQYLEIVRKLREAAPDIAISTDIIVGFPGETEEDFQETLRVVDEVAYDSAFTFLYSIRPGTPAATYEDQIPEEVKHERFGRLVDLVNAHSAEKNAALVGKTMEVLVEGASKRNGAMLAGRTDGFKLVNFEGPASLEGTLTKVTITEAKTFSLVGKLASE